MGGAGASLVDETKSNTSTGITGIEKVYREEIAL